MTNENMSGWIQEGKDAGIDLFCFEQDKILKQQRLVEMGLPVAMNILYRQGEVDWPTIDRLFSEADWFCRLIPLEGKDRPWRLRLKSRREFQEFIAGYDLSKFIINLGEKQDVSYTGGIICRDDGMGYPGRCVVEIAPVDGHEFFHGKVVPFHAEVGPWFQAIRYVNGVFPNDHEKWLVWRALRWIGGPKHPLPGYFEFEVWGDGDIRFRNYQPSDTAYAKLP